MSDDDKIRMRYRRTVTVEVESARSACGCGCVVEAVGPGAQEAVNAAFKAHNCHDTLKDGDVITFETDFVRNPSPQGDGDPRP